MDPQPVTRAEFVKAIGAPRTGSFLFVRGARKVSLQRVAFLDVSGAPKALADGWVALSDVEPLAIFLGHRHPTTRTGEWDARHGGWSRLWSASAGSFTYWDKPGVVWRLDAGKGELQGPRNHRIPARDVESVVLEVSSDRVTRCLGFHRRDLRVEAIFEWDNPAAAADPTYDEHDLAADTAWLVALGRAAAGALGVGFVEREVTPAPMLSVDDFLDDVPGPLPAALLCRPFFHRNQRADTASRCALFDVAGGLPELLAEGVVPYGAWLELREECRKRSVRLDPTAKMYWERGPDGKWWAVWTHGNEAGPDFALWTRGGLAVRVAKREVEVGDKRFPEHLLKETLLSSPDREGRCWWLFALTDGRRIPVVHDSGMLRSKNPADPRLAVKGTWLHGVGESFATATPAPFLSGKETPPP